MRLDDICLVNDDVTASDDHYRLRLGLERRMRNVRFVDFVFPEGPRLAMWMLPSIRETVGAAYPSGEGSPFRLTLRLPDAEHAVVADPDGFLTVVEPGAARIAGIELAVRDVEATTSFLATLGLTESEPGVIDGGGTPIRLVPRDGVLREDVSRTEATPDAPAAAAPAAVRADAPPAPAADGWTRNGRHLMLAVELDTGEAVDEAHATLTARGLTASGAPAVYEWGARSTYFVDPDDFIWEIYAWVEDPR